MSFDIVKSEVFIRIAGEMLKKHPELIPIFKDVLTKLKDNPYDLSLKSHKPKGILKDSYACSINYDYRIIFKIFLNFKIEGTNRNIIFLETLGTHDEVYLPILGNFTTPDLLWSAFPAQTPYQYAYNSPLTYRDPSGLAPEKEKEGEELMGDEENHIVTDDVVVIGQREETNRSGVDFSWANTRKVGDRIAKESSAPDDLGEGSSGDGGGFSLDINYSDFGSSDPGHNGSLSMLESVGLSNSGPGSMGSGSREIYLPTITYLQNNKFTVFVDKSPSQNNSMKNEIVRRHERNPLSELHNWSDHLLSTLNQFNAIKRIGIDFNNCKVYANSLFSDRKPYYGYIQDRGNVRLFGPILKNTGYILFYSGIIIEYYEYSEGKQSLLRMGADVGAMSYAFYLTGWNGILFGLAYNAGMNELDRIPSFSWRSGNFNFMPSDNTQVHTIWRR